MRDGKFRQDLFHRVFVFPLSLPPLRDRRDDIPALITHFAAQVCAQNSWKPVRFTPQAVEALQEYSWPGNVRELRNMVERLMLLAPSNEVDAATVRSVLAPGAEGSSCQPGFRDAVRPGREFRARSNPRGTQTLEFSHDERRESSWAWSAAIFTRRPSSWGLIFASSGGKKRASKVRSGFESVQIRVNPWQRSFASLPGPVAARICSRSVAFLCSSVGGVSQRELNRRVQSHLIVVVQRDEAEGLLVPGHWRQHLGRSQHRTGFRQKHQLDHRPLLQRRAQVEQTTGRGNDLQFAGEAAAVGIAQHDRSGVFEPDTWARCWAYDLREKLIGLFQKYGPPVPRMGDYRRPVECLPIFSQ